MKPQELTSSLSKPPALPSLPVSSVCVHTTSEGGYNRLAKDCEKVIHYECYNKIVLKKHKMHNPFPDDYEAACCSKAHVMKAVKMKQKATADVGANLPWDKDRKDRPNDPQNSMAILMEWLTTLGNYSKLKGNNSNGATKIQIIGELAQQINEKGVRKERTVKSVMNKLHHLTATREGIGLGESNWCWSPRGASPSTKQ
jgi:hypothetical protein